jgi:hypothetical protein
MRPACGAGESIKQGAEAPGRSRAKIPSPQKRAIERGCSDRDSMKHTARQINILLSPAFAGWRLFALFLGLTPQALCSRLLRRLMTTNFSTNFRDRTLVENRTLFTCGPRLPPEISLDHWQSRFRRRTRSQTLRSTLPPPSASCSEYQSVFLS